MTISVTSWERTVLVGLLSNANMRLDDARTKDDLPYEVKTQLDAEANAVNRLLQKLGA